MSAKKHIDAMAGKKILIAPLDWGLGHATRCIPLIKELLKNNCSVWLAGEGQQVILLNNEFPLLPVLELKGYRINYAKNGLVGKILMQLPKIFKTIKQEQSWLKKLMDRQQFDVVISDNRYGLYHKKAFSVFITHQLSIKSPWGKWSEKILQSLNYQYIHRFNECWVPDEEGDNNLAGELSHPEKLPSIPVKYIGSLSRFSYINEKETAGHLLVILSGPEPQRTILENEILNQLSLHTGSATVIRGLPGNTSCPPSTDQIKIFNHLPEDSLYKEMLKAEFIISRSGYSTVMDITAMNKKSILIPTPGQTEQEYLAGYLMKKQFAFCVTQKDFSLLQSIEKAKRFQYLTFNKQPH